MDSIRSYKPYFSTYSAKYQNHYVLTVFIFKQFRIFLNRAQFLKMLVHELFDLLLYLTFYLMLEILSLYLWTMFLISHNILLLLLINNNI